MKEMCMTVILLSFKKGKGTEIRKSTSRGLILGATKGNGRKMGQNGTT